MAELSKDEQVAMIVNLIKHWMATEKVGSIQINFFKGGITTVNLNETKKLNESLTSSTRK